MKIDISVITPTRNRAETLHRVYNSLKNQEFKNFEWIVCDDASYDNTLNLLEQYKKEAKFKIRIFSFKERAGKPKIDNFCLKKAAGKFVIFADSDDAFKKNSFKDFINEWSLIPSNKKKNIFAIISRVTTPEGKPLESKLNFRDRSISLLDLWDKYKKKKEKWLFIKKNILVKYKFPEIDYYIPEGIIWEKISLNYNVWILDNCYRVFYSDTTNSVTHSKKIKYTIGQLKSYELFILKNKNKYNKSHNTKALVNYYRYLLINNNFFNYKIRDKIKINNNAKLIYKMLAFILFFKDLITFNIDNEYYKKNSSKPIEIK